MTVGSFAVRAVGPHGQQLANVAAISTGPAAALALVKATQPFPEGTRFHVRGGAPRKLNGWPITGYWQDEAGEISPEQWAALRSWGRIERFDEDPDDALDEYRGDANLAYVIAGLILAIAAIQALRWVLSCAAQ